MLSVEMMEGGHGDALLVEYGTSTRKHRVLIDAGTRFSFDAIRSRLQALPLGGFELFVVTHVDEDHIGGAIKLLEDIDLRSRIRDVWFNGYVHLVDGGNVLGPREGERLTSLINEGFRWNFDPSLGTPFEPRQTVDVGGPIVVASTGALPTVELPGGATIYLLSPSGPKLKRMASTWVAAIEKAGLVAGEGADSVNRPPSPRDVEVRVLPDPDDEWLSELAGPTTKDGSAANGSSIAFVMEFDHKRVLFGADAHGPVLASSLKRLGTMLGEERVRIDLCKLPHHGSDANVTSEWLDLIDCQRFLFSTNGQNFGHPDHEAIARVLLSSASPVTLIGNYRNERLQLWAKRKTVPKLRVKVPAKGASGIRVEC